MHFITDIAKKLNQMDQKKKKKKKMLRLTPPYF